MSLRGRPARLIAAAALSALASHTAVAGESCLDDAALAAALPGKSQDYVSIVPGGGAAALAQTKDRLLLYDGCRLRALQRPPNEQNALEAWVFSPADLWLRTSAPKGGRGFRLVHFDGRAWSEPPGLPAVGDGPRALRAFGPRDLWIGGGSREQIAVSRWNGGRFVAVEDALFAKLPGPAVAIGGSGPNDVWIAAESSSLLLHFDGKTWRRLDAGFFAAGFWSGRDGTTWAIDSSSGNALRHWDGTRWSVVAHFPSWIEGISGAGDQPWVVRQGQILVADRDWSWRPAFAFVGRSAIESILAWQRERRTDPVALRFPSPSVRIGEPRVVSERRAFALATWNGALAALRWDGRAWTVVGKVPSELVTALMTTASGGTYAATTATWSDGARPLGRVLQYQGNAWTAIGESPAPLLELGGGEGPGPAAAEVWAVGGDGVALRCRPGRCARVPTGTSEALVGVWPAAADRIRIGGTGGSVLEWNGRSWTSIAPPRGWSLAAVSGAGPDAVWGVGAEPLRLSIVGRAAVWNTPGDFESATFGRAFNPTSMVVLASNDVWISGWVTEDRRGRADVLHWDGRQWSAFSRNLETTSLRAMRSGGRLWLAGGHGTLWRRAGTSWEILDSGTTDGIRSLAAAGDDLWIAAGDDAVPRLIHPKLRAR